MVFWQAVVLGLVQGFTEFIPVSSSGHLILVRELMGLNYVCVTQFNRLFDVTVHLGTLAAVVTVLFKDIVALFKKPFRKLFMLIAATVPAIVVGFSCGGIIDRYFSSARYLCFFFLFTAALLVIGEAAAKRGKKRPLGIGGAIAMGLMQGIAVFPGISRSGSTVFGGAIAGSDAREVATFSFLMSIPVILGSVALSAIDAAGGGALSDREWPLLVAGAISAFLAGYASVRVMLKAVEKANLKWFALYLFALAVLTFFMCFLPAVGA